MKKILLYSVEAESKTDSIRRLLNQAFDGTGMMLEEATAATLMDKLDEDVAILILPGARAGTSYREQLQGAPIDKIRDLTSGGMRLLGTCAGAFVLAEKFKYLDYDPATGALLQVKRIRSEIGMAALRAFGPDKRLYDVDQPRAEDNPWAVFTTTPVAFRFNGQDTQAALALSRGPSLTNLNPDLCQPLGRYVETGDVAIASFRFGLGGGVLSGPALEVGGVNLMQYVLPKYHADAHVARTVGALEQSHAEWSRLWVKVLDQLLPGQPALMKKIAWNLGVSSREQLPLTPRSPTP